MKIYIAGKITGNENYREKFAKAQAEIEKDGHTVLNPAVLPEGLTKADYMKICFAMIDVADMVYFLPGWQGSEGAKVEYAYCLYVGKRVMDTDIFRHVKEQTPEQIKYLMSDAFVCFSQRIKESRKNASMTQSEVGKMIGVERTIINYYESGKRIPSIKSLIQLSYLFGVSLDWLLGLENNHALKERDGS